MISFDQLEKCCVEVGKVLFMQPYLVLRTFIYFLYTHFLVRNKCERRVKFDAELVSINKFPPFAFLKLNMYESRFARVYNQFPF